MNKFFISVDENLKNRLDVFLSENMQDFSRSRIKKLIDEGNILVNGKTEKASKVLKLGDAIEISINEPISLNLQPVDIPLDIIYQDDSFAIINKQQGLTVHQGNGTGDTPTLVNALLFHLNSLSGINGVVRPGIVHRIDKNTSGLLVVAKNDKAHVSLSKQIAEKTCFRIYTALLEGIVKDDEGKIETFIDRHKTERTKMAVSNKGRKAITYYKVLKRYQEFTLCEFKLETGRTHQIRVHAKYIGHPIVGDDVYGYKKQRFNLNGQLLHATKLELTHPETNERMSFYAPLPNYFENILKIIK